MANIDMSNAKTSILPAVLVLIIGILFIAVPGAVLFWGMVLIGIFLLIMGLLNIKDQHGVDPLSIIMIILGIVMVAAPWLLPTLTQYVLGAIFIVVGALSVVNGAKDEGKNRIIGIIVGALFFIMGILLVINVWGIDILLMIVGVILVITAIIQFFKAVTA